MNVCLDAGPVHRVNEPGHRQGAHPLDRGGEPVETAASPGACSQTKIETIVCLDVGPANRVNKPGQRQGTHPLDRGSKPVEMKRSKRSGCRGHIPTAVCCSPGRNWHVLVLLLSGLLRHLGRRSSCHPPVSGLVLSGLFPP